MKQRLLSSLGLIGIAAVLATGGFSAESRNGMVSISLPPSTLVAWVFFMLAAISLEINDLNQGTKRASWWRKSISFIYDFFLFFGLLFIPLTFLYLVIALGGLPPPWSIDEVVSINKTSFVIGILLFAVFWGGMGLALHPKVRTPGMILANIDLRIKESGVR